MPNRLPRRADSCADRPPRLKMKSSPAMRYATVTTVSGMCECYRRNIRSMRCVTRKPPAMLIVASRMATRAEHHGRRRRRPAHRQHAADDDDAADGVGDAHERRVQRRRDVPDTCQPTMQASAKTVRCDRNAGGATKPSAKQRWRRSRSRRSPRPTGRRLPRLLADGRRLGRWRRGAWPARAAAPSAAAATRSCRRGRPARCARLRR